MNKNKDGYYRESFSFAGKRYNVRAKTQRDLWRKVEEKKRRLEQGIDIINENTTVDKWFTDYLETYKKTTVANSTYRNMVGMQKNYISPVIGNMRLCDVKSAHLQRIMNEVAGKSFSLATKLITFIRAAFKQARIERILTFDPSEGITMPTAEKGTHRAITADERKHILNVCKTHRAGFWVLFMLYTGARPVETRKAKWEDVRLSENRIILHSAKTDYGDRSVPINPALRPYLTGGTGYIFTQPITGAPYSISSMYHMWQTFKRALDIDMGAKTFRKTIIPETSKVAEDLTPYCMRHTFATDLQTAGVPINVAKELMGHKSIAMTARIYTHLSDEAFASAADRIAEFQQARDSGKIASIR